MNRWGIFLMAALGASLAWPTAGAQTNSPPDPRSVQQARHFEYRRAKVDYLLFLPKEMGRIRGGKWPLILYLHGSGESGTNVWRLARNGPPKHVVEHPDFPFIVVSPQHGESRSWDDDVLLALLDQLSTQYPVDTARVYLTGLSMGGFCTWALAARHPERFAAIVPVSGYGNPDSVLRCPPEKKPALQSMGIWAFHGARDSIVSPDGSRHMIEACQQAGIKDVKLTIFPKAHHNIWTRTYSNPELYEWLLKHRRG